MGQTEHPQGDTPQDAAPAGQLQPKKVRPEKPPFDPFLEQWCASIEDRSGGVGKLRKLLRNGFVGDTKHEQVVQVADALLQNPRVAERIAVLLAAQSRAGKLNSLSRSVLELVRKRFSAAIDYYPDDFSGANGAYAVDRYVEAHAPRRRGAVQSRQTGAAEEVRPAADASEMTADSWLRRFFVCLCAESERTVFISGAIAAGKWWLTLHSPAFAEARGEANLARAFSNAICSGAISKQKLELIFTGIGPLQQQFTGLLNSELDLKRKIQHRDDAIETLKREKGELESRLATSQDETAAAQTQIAELQRLLKEAAEKYQLLDQHWRAVSEQSLNKQSGSFRERIGHELQEALLSLGRQTPNVSMGLLRLKRIEEILKGDSPKEE